MKKLPIFILIIVFLLCSCSTAPQSYDIVATTLPVYDFTTRLCAGTDLTVGRLITESVSCLHNYTLKTDHMRMIENADVIFLSGAGLEDFLTDALKDGKNLVDCSVGTHVHAGEHTDHSDHDHVHENDPHIWLSTDNAAVMAENICTGLSLTYPQHQEVFQANLYGILAELNALQTYGETQLADLSCREMITFHDGFAYLAEGFDLHILEAIEEESGSEASAKEIIHLVQLIQSHQLPAVFTEVNGSDACAEIIRAETDVAVFTLDMAMSGDSYFQAMYHNIDTIKEALK